MAMQRLIFDADHDMFRDQVRRFFQKEIAPHAEKWRERGYVDREAFLKAGEQGYLLMYAAPEYGGAGVADFRYEQIVYEENIRHGEIGFYINLHSGLVGPYLNKLGTPEQKARFLPGCISGETILAVAMTEPGAGSDLAGMKPAPRTKATIGCSTAPKPTSPTATWRTSWSSPPAARTRNTASACSWSSAA